MESGDCEETERLLRYLLAEQKESAIEASLSGKPSLYSATVDYNMTTKEGLTLLHLCCFLGDEALQCVRLLVELGADTQRCDQNGWTPLHFAAYGNQRKVISFLLDKENIIRAGRSSY